MSSNAGAAAAIAARKAAGGKKLSRQLIAICSKCKEPVIVRDAEKTSLVRLGRMIRRANRSGFEVHFVDDPPETVCTCEANRAVSGKWARFSIRQILFAMTVVGVVLAIFRHPISGMLDESVWKSAVGPWTVLGNLILGTEIIDPKPHFKKSVLAAVAFTISTPLAVLTAWFTVQFGCVWVYRAWLEISDD